MKYHHEKYGHTTWHWTNVPESVLYDAGFIHDFNRLRLKRKETFEKDGSYYNPIREYGLDGIAEEKREDRVIYNGIQSKFYEPTSYLKASDLGTFYQVLFFRLRKKCPESKGYLYHTCRLQIDVSDDIDENYGNLVVRELLPMNSTTLITSPTSSTKELSTIHESMYKLRGYQEEAITILGMGWTGVGLLNLPCGTGKTVIFSNHLREKKYKNVIIVSPLRVQAEQTLKRVKEFLPEYDQLLLDSDGSTDADTLNEMMEKRSVISTTFKSFVQVIGQLFIECDSSSDSEMDSVESSYESIIDLSDTLLIIDEAHNVASMSDEKQEMIKIIQSFPKTLLVTATPPSCMEEMIGCTTIYQYPFRRAIEEGHICDYEVYLPMVTMNETSGESSIYIEKPMELSDLNGDMVQKSLYLLNGMLQTGSRRCIGYLSQKKECDLFMKALIETNSKYHYLDLSVSSITNLTSASKRKKIIEEFEKDDGRGEIKILCSIRILDEGVDIPVCDSVFVGNVTESSNEIKMVQRICRANRLVESQPNKVARCFLWADDYQKIVESLSLLKQNDIEFHKKITAMNGNYEKTGHTETTDICKKHNAMINDFITVKCMTWKEIWEMKRQRVFKFCDANHGKRPSAKSKDEFEKKDGRWLAVQIKKITNIDDELYKNLAENLNVKKLIDETLEGRGKCLTYNESKQLCFAFCNKNDGKRPSQTSKDTSEKKSGVWLHTQILKIKSVDDDLYKDLAENNHVKKLIDESLERRGKDRTYEESKLICFAFCNSNKGKRPSKSSKDQSVKKCGGWLSTQIKKIKSIDDELYKDLAENLHVKKLIDETLEGRSIDKWEENKLLCFSFCDENNGKRPSKSSKDYSEGRSGKWLCKQISKIKSVDDQLYKDLAENLHVKKLIDETLEGRGTDKWKENKELCFAFCDANNGKRPSKRSKNDSEKKSSKWLADQISKIKSIDDELYKDLAENDHVKKLIDETLSKRKVKA